VRRRCTPEACVPPRATPGGPRHAEEDRQNKQLIDLSTQILGLTKEVRAFAGKAQEDNAQNKQLLDLSKQTLELTRDVHARAGATEPAEPASSTDPQPPSNGRSSR
jgi:hypothetical protein